MSEIYDPSGSSIFFEVESQLSSGKWYREGIIFDSLSKAQQWIKGQISTDMGKPVFYRIIQVTREIVKIEGYHDPR